MPPLAKRTKGVYPPLLEGKRDPRRHQRAGIAPAHHPLALKTTARSDFPLELVNLATPSPSRSQARALSNESASATTVVLGITRAQPFYGVPESVKAFGNTTFVYPLPWLILPTIIIIALVWYALNRQRFGRYVLAVGGNSNAAELSGISVFATVLRAHALSGFLAALAGVMLVARLGIGQPTIGDDWLILSFAAPVIGGAALAGGHVSVAGTVLGVAIVAIITQALVLFEIDPFLVQVVLGALILWAVSANRVREVRMQKSLKRIA